MRKPVGQLILVVTTFVLGPMLTSCGGSGATTTITAPPAETTTTSAQAVTTTEAATTTEPPTTTTTTTQPPSTTTTVPTPPAAGVVWEQTLAGRSYRSWQTAPGHETPQPATGPHGVKDQVFMNETVVRTLDGPPATAWPVGSAIVKDVYNRSGTLIILEYMQRTGEGWYYASFQSSGRVVTEGVSIERCQNCHGGGSDSVFTFKLP